MGMICMGISSKVQKDVVVQHIDIRVSYGLVMCFFLPKSSGLVWASKGGLSPHGDRNYLPYMNHSFNSSIAEWR